jgi:hypothetical protein
LDTGLTPAELEQRLAQEFDVEREQLAHEVDELLKQLASEQLIRTE